MATHDWNHDGKNDMIDNYIEYWSCCWEISQPEVEIWILQVFPKFFHLQNAAVEIL